LIDAAPVVNGKIGRDHLVFADFIPNDWSAWPNTYHHVDILERGPARAVIRITRDWGQATITTLYTLTADADAVEIRTQCITKAVRRSPTCSRADAVPRAAISSACRALPI